MPSFLARLGRDHLQAGLQEGLADDALVGGSTFSATLACLPRTPWYPDLPPSGSKLLPKRSTSTVSNCLFPFGIANDDAEPG